MKKFTLIIMPIVLSCILFFGAMPQVSEATVIPGAKTSIPYVSESNLDDDWKTIWSTSAPEDNMVVNTIEIRISCGSDYYKYQPYFRILVDGIVEYSTMHPPEYEEIRTITGLSGKNITFQAEEGYEGRQMIIHGGTIEWGVNLADEEARDAAIDAKNAANNAKGSADAAHTDAQAARNMLNGSSNGGKSLAATYNKANSANTNAANAKSSADSAKSSADAAKSEATAAKNNSATAASRVWDTAEGKSAATLSKEARDKADDAAGNTTYNGNTAAQLSSWANTHATRAEEMLNGTSNGGKSLASTYDKANSASSRVWDSTEGKSAATLSKEARDKANDAAGDTTYIRNTQLPSLENKIANLETTVNNINNDIMAPIVEVQTVSGARATSASSIPSIFSVTDNSTGPFEYKVNGGTWVNLPHSGEVSIPVTQPGMNTITVEVKDPSGNIGKDVIIIRKL